MTESCRFTDHSVIATQKPINHVNPRGESTESLAPADSFSDRRIDFHLAKKPFTGFANVGGDGSFVLETLNATTTSSKITGSESVGGGYSGKKRDAPELENGLDQELSFGITFGKIGAGPAGLENLGNTCFLNSVLQCLTYTEPLAAYLLSGKHQVTCQKSGFCALCAIQKHVSRALQLSGRSLAPKDLVSNLHCISRTFRNSRQEDAHEYMVNLLESMHKCCLPNGVSIESQSAYDKSLVHKIFGGQLRNQVKCMQCNYCSDKFDAFLDLSLEILQADTLYEAFANFTSKEHLDGGAKQYRCQQCKQKVKALKQLTVYKAPNVLTIHLKRFGCHMSGQKIDKNVLFSPTLDLKPFVTGPYDGDLTYTLYGVLVHAGWSTDSGHYYCFVRTSSGMWYALDDNRVFQVSENMVFEQEAYMLFYFRDKKNFPSKNTDVHQKEKIVMNGASNGPGEPTKAQMKMALNNRSSNAQTSMKHTAEKENIVMNGTPNGPGAPREVQRDTDLSNGLLNAHMSSATLDTVRSQQSPGAPKEAQMKTGPIDGSLNVQKSLDAVGIEENGFDPVALEETQTNSNLSSRSRVSQKCSAIAGTMITGFSTASKPEHTQMKETSLPISISDYSNTEDCTKENFMENNDFMGKPRRKVKNFSKYNLISMKFSSNVLMKSLKQRKKKKHKRDKQRNKHVKNLAQENLVNEGSSLLVKIEAQEMVKPPVVNIFKDRVDEDGAVLATNDFNTESQLNPKDSNQLENSRRSLSQEDLLHMPTSGIDDQTVPRWEDDEAAPSQTFIERRHDLTVGYVGDEWDEEYDRGKMKKVRICRSEFDGKILFQDIANVRLKALNDQQNLSKTLPPKRKNKHFKKSGDRKFKKSGAGNVPYRI
ncbi:hypothetical protein E3N88_05875 [Mikania micrantha]|uniref:Ubiquitin carboxyl-terminal hydrolase n=1 Tax=Mikania micrantha TaxID=192012 RepID=A0A5N6PQ47_9ASTR|nr:hypothetical protein E3N88_05875 [Mikania micrantha]